MTMLMMIAKTFIVMPSVVIGMSGPYLLCIPYWRRTLLRAAMATTMDIWVMKLETPRRATLGM